MLGKLLKRKRIIVTVIVCLALLGGTWVWAQSHRQTSTTTYLFGTVARGTLAASASASGNLMAGTQANVSAQISGTVVAIRVAQGDTVRSGQILYEVHNQTATADIATAYGAYVTAGSTVEHAKTDELQAEAANATVQNDTTSTPAQKNVAAQQVTAAQAATQSAEQNQSAAWLHYGITRDQAAQQTIRSPIDGAVTDAAIKVGDQVGGGSGSRVGATQSGTTRTGGSFAPSTSSGADMTIQDMSTIQAQVAVNEVDVSRVAVGQHVNLSFDAINGLTTTGVIQHVAATGSTSQGVVTYQATITLTAIDLRLRPGMTVSATIVTQTKDNVLYVPITAVTTSDGQQYVQVWDNNAPRRAAVHTGLASDTDIEITSGLSQGQRVITQIIHPTTSGSTTASNPLDTSGGASTNNPKGK